VQHVLADGDLVAARCVMSGRHTGPFVTYDADGRIDQAFPPTGRSFASTQTHLYRMEDGLIAEHWANRDDLGQAAQLGWIPPSPVFLLRGALLKRRLSRR
jgi:predicted ester cyclase